MKKSNFILGIALNMKRAAVTMAAKHMTSAAIWRPKVAPRALGIEQYAVELK